MPYLMVQGIRIYYAARIGGEKNFIFLHGAGGNHLNWYYQLEYLKDSFNLFAIDLPGHGNSEGVPCDSIPCYARFLSEFLNKTGLSSNIVLVGHSMGGLVIEEYLKKGGHCDTVVMISSSYRIKKNNSPRDSLEFCHNLFYTERAIQRCVETAEIILGRVRDVLKVDLKATSEVNYRDILQNFKVPFLLIHGNRDRLIPLEDVEDMDRLLPISNLIVINNAGHMVMIEKFMDVNSKILNYFGAL